MVMCCSGIALAVIAVPFHQAGALPRNKERPQSTRVVTPQPVSPLLLLVSIRKQRIRAFDVTGELNSSRISTGMRGFDTPTGVFSVLEKQTYHESNIYEGAPMPFMQRLTWSGIALHAGVVPGYRASHGCIR
jgi:lipoprotein-anchoring transpeptidase ErfK/SrfK